MGSTTPAATTSSAPRPSASRPPPSIVQLSTVRVELARIRSLAEQAAEGRWALLRALPAHLSACEKAQRDYASLPQFPGEPQLSDEASARLAKVRAAAETALALADAEASGEVAALLRNRLVPATAEADGAVIALVQLNHDLGDRAARDADVEWRQTRRASIAADALCAAFAGALAWFGLRGTRRSALEQKRRADELEAFASRVAHDVRGPLTPALLALQTLSRDPSGDERRRETAERGARSLRRVDDLVGDLLAFARAGATPQPGASASLRVAVTGVVQDVEAQAASAGVLIDVADFADGQVACAPGVLSSVLSNLVTNAIKYMPADARTRVVAIDATARRGRLRVEIADTGAGLPANARDRVFDPYVRLDGDRPGLGLGLATVRRLVQAHRGEVGVRPRDGGGSVFWFELPSH